MREARREVSVLVDGKQYTYQVKVAKKRSRRGRNKSINLAQPGKPKIYRGADR